MTDLLEQRLHRAAQHWQETQPAPPGVPVDRLVGSRSRRSRDARIVLAAAAAVVVVAAGAVVIGSLGSSGGSPSPTSSSTHRVGVEHPAAVPWADLPAGHPDVRKRYDRVSAVGSITGRAKPGDVIVFEAVLESSTDLPLDPCPDYNIAFGRHSYSTRQLNCSAVPYRDDRGRPYLPAFENVRFEMQVTVPDEPGEQKVLWTLDGPQRMPGFYGLVRVR